MLLRILHVTPYYEEAWAYGGIPRVATALTRELARRGHEVTVCTTDARDERSRLAGDGAARSRGGPWASVRHAEGVTVRVFPNLSNRLAYGYQFFVPRGLSRFLREHVRDFQIAHVHGYHHLLGVLTARHAHHARLPYVVAPNGTAPRLERRRAAKWIFDVTLGRRVLPRAVRVLAVSEAERRQLRMLCADSRLETIPNPLALDEFADLPPRGRFRARLGLRGESVVLYLGKLTPRKRLDILIDAFSRLRRPDARLVIAGNDMGSGTSIRRQIEQQHLSHVSYLPGLLVGRERLEALQDADVVAYPSQHEVFGLVPFEALLCGTPAVVADDSGCCEHLRRVGGGLVAPQGDGSAFSDAITRILAEPDRWRAEAGAAAARVRSSLGAGAVCDRLERLYHDVVGVTRAAGDGA